MSAAEDPTIDEQIRKILPDAIPPSVENRMRRQFADFRGRLATTEEVATGRSRRRVRLGWLGFACAAATVVMAAIAIGLMLRPGKSLAAVAAAVLQRPWIHVKAKHPDGNVYEAWYSPATGITAERSNRRIEFSDSQLQLAHEYDPREQVLYRCPLSQRAVSAPDFESLRIAMAILIKEGGASDKSLKHLDFILGKAHARMTILTQKMDKVTENGREWIDYQLTVKYPLLADPVRILLRIDPTTNLPQQCRFSGVENGNPASRELSFTYPETGPADIYDLGVPKSAKYVDRVPPDDLKQILRTLQAGRQQMDDYRAIFVNRSEGLDDMWWTELPMIWYRKGNKFRANYVAGWDGELAAVVRPAEGVDLGAWWRERVKFFHFYPQYVTRDSTIFSSTCENVSDADGTKHKDITSVLSTDYNRRPEDMFPSEWSMRPEFVCRPPLGIGGSHQEPTIDLHPSDGPAGCILLRVRHTTTEGRIKDRNVGGTPDEWRYWLDPQRDYIVIRQDMILRDEDGKEEIIDNHTVEEASKSPRGVWYATKIRRKNAGHTQEGKPFDQVYYLYVDFNVDLPDSLFVPPKPGRIH